MRATGVYGDTIPSSHVPGYEAGTDVRAGRTLVAEKIGRIANFGPDFADLFDTYSKRGLPYDLISLVVADARNGAT